MKLGIVVDNLGPSQLSYNMIRNINLYTTDKTDLDCIGFYQNFVRPCFSMNFAAMQIYEAWGYNGTFVATNLNNAAKTIDFPFSNNKFFYVWDLEWIRMRQKHFSQLHNVYANSNISLIARSNSHKTIIEDCWNVPVIGIVDDFNMDQLLEVINANSK